MSDFFEEKNCKIKNPRSVTIGKNNMSPTLVTAIDNLLCPDSNMFTSALTVKRLMELEKLSVAEAAEQLSLKLTDVSNKLRLLEYSEDEKNIILGLGLTEKSAVRLLDVQRMKRTELFKECAVKKLYKGMAEEYIKEKLENEKKEDKKVHLRKFSVCDAGFLMNSLDKAVSLAKQAGMKIENDMQEDDVSYSMTIRVQKNGKRINKGDAVDKNGVK